MDRAQNGVPAIGMSRRRLLAAFGLAAVGVAMIGCAGSSAPAAAPAAAPAVAPAAPAPAAAVILPTATTAPAAAAVPTATSVPVAAAAPTATAAPAAAAAPTIVNMNDQYKFDPAAITIAKGTAVTWKGQGTQPHTVTFDPAKAMNKAHVVLPSGVAPFDSGLLNPGQSYSHTFTVSGDYSYICIPHEAMGMIGTIKVT